MTGNTRETKGTKATNSDESYGGMKAGLQAALQAEVETAHAFISAWFRGDVPQSAEIYARQWEDRLAPGLINIQPSGQILTREQLVEGIREGYASNPEFRIEIREGELRGFDSEGGLALFTYAEHQTDARQTVPADNVRVSSVLFSLQTGSARPLWVHIHETARQDPPRS